MSNITEKVIQDYIWENRNNLYDLIDVANFPNEIPVDKPWEIKPYELIYNNWNDPKLVDNLRIKNNYILVV